MGTPPVRFTYTIRRRTLRAVRTLSPRWRTRPTAVERTPPRLALAHRLLATVLDQRFAMPQPVIGDLFGVKRMTINKAFRETRQLLTQVRHAIEPADMRLDTLADLADLAAPTRPTRPRKGSTSPKSSSRGVNSLRALSYIIGSARDYGDSVDGDPPPAG